MQGPYGDPAGTNILGVNRIPKTLKNEMISYYKTVLTLIVSLSAISTCTNNHANKINIPAKECIKLNNDGVDYLMNYSPADKEGGKKLNKAIDLFEQAIKCDSTYITAYISLASAYNQKQNYVEEMKIVKKLIILSNNSPAILTWRGELFERMNQIDSAKKMYHLAKAGYENKLIKYPENIDGIQGLILLKALTDGKDEAINEIKEQIKLHPGLSSKLSNLYVFYQSFDRHTFIYGISN